MSPKEIETNLTETQELTPTETFLKQNYIDKLHEENEQALAELKEKNAKLAEYYKTERARKLVIQLMRKRLPYLNLCYKSPEEYGYKAEDDPLTKLSKKEFDQLLTESENHYKTRTKLNLGWLTASLGGGIASFWPIVWAFTVKGMTGFGLFMGGVAILAGFTTSLLLSIKFTKKNLKVLKDGPKV